jgi:hypothetical protein
MMCQQTGVVRSVGMTGPSRASHAFIGPSVSGWEEACGDQQCKSFPLPASVALGA